MRILFAVFFLLFHGLSVCAQTVESTLDKYSYLVQSSRQQTVPQAIGFFVRYEKRLFLITSACFEKTPSTTAMTADHPDTIFVQSSIDTGRSSLVSLPVIRLKKQAKSTDASDICVVEIKNSNRYRLFSVEDFFTDEVPCESAKSVVIAGYAKQNAAEEQDLTKQQPFLFTTMLEEAYCFLTYQPDRKDYDKLHYFPSFAKEAAKPVLSGAPAYLLTKDDDIVFGGVYVGMSNGSTRGKIMRPEYVIDRVINRINQR